jgi:hypothetical protein
MIWNREKKLEIKKYISFLKVNNNKEAKYLK